LARAIDVLEQHGYVYVPFSRTTISLHNAAAAPVFQVRPSEPGREKDQPVVNRDTWIREQMSKAIRAIVFPKTYKLSGAAQKGPFGDGTQITVAELDKMLAPIGRTFTSTITSSSGTFSIPNVQLSSPYVKLTASGFYFDELANALTVAPLTINAIADVTNASTVNVNLISALEGPRGRAVRVRSSVAARWPRCAA
jgi:hypothetical protein